MMATLAIVCMQQQLRRDKTTTLEVASEAMADLVWSLSSVDSNRCEIFTLSSSISYMVLLLWVLFFAVRQPVYQSAVGVYIYFL